MQTVYDWISLGLFSALALLFLHRSVAPALPGDHVLLYLPPTLGCVATNLLGNKGHPAIAITALITTVVYTGLVLRPWRRAG